MGWAGRFFFFFFLMGRAGSSANGGKGSKGLGSFLCITVFRKGRCVMGTVPVHQTRYGNYDAEQTSTFRRGKKVELMYTKIFKSFWNQILSLII